MRTAFVAVMGLAIGTWTTSALAAGRGSAPGAAAQPAPAPPPPAPPAPPTAAPAPVAPAPVAPAPVAPAPAPAPEHAAPAEGGVHVEGGAHAEHGEHAAHDGMHHGEHAEDAEGEEEPEKDHLEAGADIVFGFGRQEVGADKSFATSFLLGAKYHFVPWFNLGLRWPVMVGSLAGESGRSAVGNVGNIELAPEVEIELARGVKLPIELGFALPTAGGDPYNGTDDGARQQAAINEIAAGSRGGEDNALFEPQRFGLVPRIGIELERGPIEASFYTKMELLFKAGGQDPAPVTNLERKSPAAEWVTGASLFWRVLPKHLSIGTRAWVSYAAVEPTAQKELPQCSDSVVDNCLQPGQTAAEPSKVQFVLDPGIKAQFGAFRSSLSYILPIGGALADKGYGGVRLGLGFAY
jgi:hypothetical protein